MGNHHSSIKSKTLKAQKEKVGHEEVGKVIGSVNPRMCLADEFQRVGTHGEALVCEV